MAINKNHEFEDLDGVKCAIVEKNASKERAAFLKQLLEYNKYTVIMVPSPPLKVAPPPKPAEPLPENAAGQGEILQVAEPPTPTPETFTIGVTDVVFNPTNAIFGKTLKVPGGHIVTLAYWQQKESVSHDEIPYFDQKL
jgi:hypothetical protein